MEGVMEIVIIRVDILGETKLVTIIRKLCGRIFFFFFRKFKVRKR